MVQRPPFDRDPPPGGFDPRFGNSPDPRREEIPSFGGRPAYGDHPDPYGRAADPYGRSADPYQGGPDPFDRRSAPPPPPVRRGGFSRSTRILLALAAVLLLGAILFAWSLTRSGPGSDALGGEGETKKSAADRAEARCAAPATYDKLKRELLRQAAAARGADPAIFERLAGYAAIRVSDPVLRDYDEDREQTNCSGTVSLDLPPGVQLADGRRTVSASLGYSLQPAADGNGEVLTLDGAEAITASLATLGRAGPSIPTTAATQQTEGAPSGTDSLGQPVGNVPPVAPSPPQARPAPDRELPSRPEPAPPPPAPVQVAPPPRTSSANPSFNCARASNRAERAVCADSGLAALDRQMSNRFFSARQEANVTQRVLLDRTRGAFLTYRNRCGSDSCIASAYRDRIREINDIMADRWVAPR